jgi:hypothetical protein
MSNATTDAPLKLPYGLLSVEDAAKKTCMAPARLRSYANGGFAPHYRVDGEPVFKITELREWVDANLVIRIEAKNLPDAVRVVVRPSEVEDFRKVPHCLREIAGLCDITDKHKLVGVYFLCRNGELLYVGQSVDTIGRVSTHASSIHLGKHQFDTVLFLPWPQHDLDRVEGALIRTLRPPLNGKQGDARMIAPGNQVGDAATIAEITNRPADAA